MAPAPWLFLPAAHCPDTLVRFMKPISIAQGDIVPNNIGLAAYFIRPLLLDRSHVIN